MFAICQAVCSLHSSARHVANLTCILQNFILIAGAETRRTFAKDEERKYPGMLPVRW